MMSIRFFANTEEWWLSIPKDVRPRKNQPFYHLFAENGETEYVAYVSEQNLLPDTSGEPLRHPQIDEIFERTEDGALSHAHCRAPLTIDAACFRLRLEYGSCCAMARRCPNSIPLGKAQLARHRFVIMPQGYASVVPDSRAHVRVFVGHKTRRYAGPRPL